MTEKKKMTVWELGEETMAHSMLIFLLADLRILSATGRIRTRYEHLCIDSDKSPRHSANDFAGYHKCNETRGVTAAHIMAVLMLEIRDEAEEVSGTKKKSILLEEHLGPFVFGRKDVEKASGMPALLHCYNEMVASDIASDEHKVRKADYLMDLGEEAGGEVKRADFDPDVVDEEGEDLFHINRRASMALFRSKSARDLRPSREGRGMNKTNMVQSIANIQNAMVSNASAGDSSDCYNQDEILMLLKQSVETRNRNQNGFMKHFFKEGSISRVLVESKAEMVWLSDWHTTHECTYAISIDREEKKVLLAFRGCYTRSDWAHAFATQDTATSNPIKKGAYPNWPKNIRVHGGFHKYLFRVRKDTGSTKYDEIAAKLMHYCNIVGDGVTLTVTGHSLGAAYVQRKRYNVIIFSAFLTIHTLQVGDGLFLLRLNRPEIHR